MLHRTTLVGVFLVAIASLWAEATFAGLGNGSSAIDSAHTHARPLVAWELVRSEEATIVPNSSSELIANCASGKVPIGGGFSKAPSTPDSAGGVEIASSFPVFFTFDGQAISGWVVHVVNRGTENAFVTVWATCARRDAHRKHSDW